MLGVIGVVSVVAVATLFHKRCAQCGAKNGLDATVCQVCGAPFDDNGDTERAGGSPGQE